jgi:lipopolysaccharide export system protein LptA
VLRWYLLSLALLGLCAPSWAQDSSSTRRIEVEHADRLLGSKRTGKSRLLGNVRFSHEGALMFCDSAWLFSRENRLRAFRNVRLNQGDTLFLTGDYLEYNGQTRQALVTGDTVTLRDPQMTLLTDRLRHNREQELSYYTTGGRIINEENVLTSRRGYYHSGRRMFYFKDSVVLTNPDYVMRSDTLDYSSYSRIAYFKGPSTITSDSSYIYCENGLYRTQEDVAQFEKNAYLYDGNRSLTGDSLYYEKYHDYGEAFGHVRISDTVENYLLTGAYGQYSGHSDSAFVTGQPIYSLADAENDSLHVHGDTIYSTQPQDSTTDPYRLVQVFHGVRFYKTSLQGRCDSLTYSSHDSTFRLYRQPLLWDDSTQVSGDTIYLSTRQQQPDSLFVLQNAFMTGIVDSLRYNQISGREITGKFVDKALRRVYVNGNGQAIYYPEEENGDLMGMNRSLCANMVIYLSNSRVEKIILLNEPEGKMYPLQDVPEDKKRLEGFAPQFDLRPRSKKDILR